MADGITLRRIEIVPEVYGELVHDELFGGKSPKDFRPARYRLTFEITRGRQTAQATVEVERYGHGRQKRHKQIEKLEREALTKLRKILRE